MSFPDRRGRRRPWSDLRDPVEQGGRVRLRDIRDMVVMVPYLLGFRPTESVVIMLVRDGRVAMTARFDLALCDHPTELSQQLSIICNRMPEAHKILLAFSEDPERAEEALGQVEVAIGGHGVIDSIVADGRYCRSRHSGDGSPMDYTSLTSTVQAEAVLAGMTALPDRSALANQVRWPEGEAIAEAEASWASARGEWARANLATRTDAAEERLLRALLDPDSVDDRSACDLGVLIGDVRVRDALWLSMRRDSAARHLQVWLRVVAQVPAQHSVPALAMAGMAAWLTGNGALQVVCLEKGEEIDRSYSMLRLLSDINLTASPPSVWDSMPTSLP